MSKKVTAHDFINLFTSMSCLADTLFGELESHGISSSFIKTLREEYDELEDKYSTTYEEFATAPYQSKFGFTVYPTRLTDTRLLLWENDDNKLEHLIGVPVHEPIPAYITCSDGTVMQGSIMYGDYFVPHSGFHCSVHADELKKMKNEITITQ
jgi:hypothetical protein